MSTKTELYKKIIKAAGGDDNTPDNLETTLLGRIAECVSGGGGSLPFGEETVYGDTLTWDGKASGTSSPDGIHYKVSDNVPTLEDFAGGFEFVVGGETANVPDNTGFTQIMPTVLEFEDSLFWIVSEDTDAGGGTIVAKGTYFLNNGEFAVTSLKIPNYTFAKTTLKQLDNKYLEPFETVGGDTLTWDGNTDGHVFVSVNTAGEGFCQVSNSVLQTVPSKGEYSVTLSNGNTITGEGTSESYEWDLMSTDQGDLIALSEFIFSIPCDDFVMEEGLILPKKGIYFVKMNSVSIASLTINGYTGFPTTKLKAEYLPYTDAESEVF